MKKIMRTYLTAFATTALLFAAASCDSLQDSLSSEQNAKVLEETGTPSLADKVWYYNGAATQDVTGSAGYLKIDYGQQIRESSAGISGSFVISYTDAQTELVTTVTKDLAGGFVSEDGTSYCLDMTPVIKMLDYDKYIDSKTFKSITEQTFKDGTADVTVTLSGLICNAGDQKGRAVSSFSKKISVQPLYTKTTLETNFCNTTGATAGTRFIVPVEGAVTIEKSATNLSVTGSNVPDGITFTLDGISEDGKKIYFVADQDLSGKMFDATVKLYGITPITSGIGYSKSFSTIFAAGTMSDDVRNDDSSKNSAPLRDVLVYNDASNLYVRVDFDDDAKLWHHNSITILLDNASSSEGIDITLAKKNATNNIEENDTESAGLATGKVTLAEGSSVEAQICTVVTGNDGGGGAKGTVTTPATVTVSDIPIVAAQYAAMPTSVTYQIPLADVGGLVAGNKVYVFAAISARDNGTSASTSTGTVGLMNWATSEAVTAKETSLDWNSGLLYDTVTIDMTKAISHTIVE